MVIKRLGSINDHWYGWMLVRGKRQIPTPTHTPRSANMSYYSEVSKEQKRVNATLGRAFRNNDILYRRPTSLFTRPEWLLESTLIMLCLRWMCSRVPTVCDAILDGEPFDVRRQLIPAISSAVHCEDHHLASLGKYHLPGTVKFTAFRHWLNSDTVFRSLSRSGLAHLESIFGPAERIETTSRGI
jgi:hypothetical protein